MTSTRTISRHRRPRGMALLAVIWLIAILGLSAICFLYWGFKCAIAPARWVGLSLLALLAFRLIVVDLSQTATIVRVALLFAAGLVLVGTSIAYAMWKPKV